MRVSAEDDFGGAAREEVARKRERPRLAPGPHAVKGSVAGGGVSELPGQGAEGAGAASLAAAMHDPRVKGNVVCVISGGNIDTEDYVQALQGQVPVAK